MVTALIKMSRDNAIINISPNNSLEAFKKTIIITTSAKWILHSIWAGHADFWATECIELSHSLQQSGATMKNISVPPVY